VTGDLVPILVIVIIAFVSLRFVENRMGHRLGEDSHNCEEEIRQLRAQLEAERLRNQEESRRKDQQIRDLEERVDWLVSQLQRAGIQVRDMEKALAALDRPRASVAPIAPLPPKPLLIVCGPDTAMCDLDRHALRRAGVSFQRIYHASKRLITDELRRRRQDGTLYPWLHVTAHAGEVGIELSDGLAEPTWWHEQLDGVQVIFLAACKSATVADELAGLCTVVFVQDEIDSQAAADFTYCFWRHMREHGDPQQAYRQAIAEVPAVAEFTDIRDS
jgi:hypothetical protein